MFWLHINGNRIGPLTIEQVREMNISPDTPVWYQGLADWTPASQAPLTAHLFNIAPDQVMPENEPVAQQAIEQQPVQQQGAYYQGAHSPASAITERPERPKTYLFWSIMATICCCVPFGIAAIIFAARSSSMYNMGNYAAAEKASINNQWCLILAFVLGLISLPFTTILAMMGN